jgi:iron complex transport system ATP-binding protein
MELIIENLTCGYGDKPIVDGFSAKVSSGEIFCLLGPNGIGKTTLFKTILGFIPPLSGRVGIAGTDLADLSAREIARLIGYVPQSHAPPFAFTVADVIVMGRVSRMGVFGRPGKEDYAFADGVIERLGIGFLRDRNYMRLSGGERQMVLIARALAQQPAFLMMDEPTSNLDFGNQAIVLENILKLAKEGLGIILTTHDPGHVLQCRAEAALMKNGGGFHIGGAAEVITEENLQETYGIPVAVIQAKYKNENLCCCRPILREDGRAPEQYTRV